jgi:hypothetical protein
LDDDINLTFLQLLLRGEQLTYACGVESVRVDGSCDHVGRVVIRNISEGVAQAAAVEYPGVPTAACTVDINDIMMYYSSISLSCKHLWCDKSANFLSLPDILLCCQEICQFLASLKAHIY